MVHIQRMTLPNGLRILHVNTQSIITTVHATVLVGSAYEPSGKEGISHVIEHMLFEGTATRTAEQIASEVEYYGAEMNAYTSTSKTGFYIKIKSEHAPHAMEVLSDMLINPLFDEQSLAKEQNVIVEEINMINDQPRQYQWLVFERKALPEPFSKPPYGTAQAVQSLKAADLHAFHTEHYIAPRIILTVVGPYRDLVKDVATYFGGMKTRNQLNEQKYSGQKYHEQESDIQNTHQVYEEHKNNLTSQYTVIGYQTPPRNHPDSYVLDVIRAILAKGQSGSLFIEVRTKRGLTYDIGVYHDAANEFGFFACYASAEEKKISIIRDIFMHELQRMDTVSDAEIHAAVAYIEGNRALSCEDSQTYADMLSFCEECGDVEAFNTYYEKIRAVTVHDIAKVRNKYLNDAYTQIILKP